MRLPFLLVDGWESHWLGPASKYGEGREYTSPGIRGKYIPVLEPVQVLPVVSQLFLPAPPLLRRERDVDFAYFKRNSGWRRSPQDLAADVAVAQRSAAEELLSLAPGNWVYEIVRRVGSGDFLFRSVRMKPSRQEVLDQLSRRGPLWTTTSSSSILSTTNIDLRSWPLSSGIRPWLRVEERKDPRPFASRPSPVLDTVRSALRERFHHLHLMLQAPENSAVPFPRPLCCIPSRVNPFGVNSSPSCTPEYPHAACEYSGRILQPRIEEFLRLIMSAAAHTRT